MRLLSSLSSSSRSIVVSVVPTSNFTHAATSHLPPLLAAPLPLVLPLLPLLSGWLLHRLSSCCHVPCQRLLLRHRLSFLRSCASRPAGCCIGSPHAAVSHLPATLPGGLGPGGKSLGATIFSSRHTVASCSAALAPLIWLVVVSPLLTPLHPLPAPPPLVAPSPLVPPLSRLLSGWLLCCHPPCPPTAAPPTPCEQGAARARPAPIAGRGPPSTTLRTAPPRPCPCPAWQGRKQAPPLLARHRIRRTGTTMPPPYRTQRRHWQHQRR